jgi:hypothetical protein
MFRCPWMWLVIPVFRYSGIHDNVPLLYSTVLLYYCIPVFLYYYIHLLYSFTVFIYCIHYYITVLLYYYIHSLYSCTVLLYSFTVFIYCIHLLHSSTAFIYSSTVFLSYPPPPVSNLPHPLMPIPSGTRLKEVPLGGRNGESSVPVSCSVIGTEQPVQRPQCSGPRAQV